MADVFISYARADQAKVEKLAEALESSGYSLWWDRHLQGGSEYSKDIETAIAEAKAVIVAWSKASVESEWVRDEAAFARDANKLVPIQLDGTSPPLGYRQRQSILFAGGRFDDAGMAKLRAAVDRLVGSEHRAAPRPASGVGGPRKRWLVLGVAALLGVALIALLIVRGPGPASLFAEEQGAQVSLAVMPFEVSGGGDQDYLGAGIAGTLSSGLAGLEGLQLIAGTSTNALAGQQLTATEIGNRLGVSHLVEGNIRPQGRATAIDVRLVEATSGRQLWAETFEGPSDRLSNLQNRALRAVASALQSRLSVGRGALAASADVDPAAYDAYLRGIEKVFNRDSTENRIEAFQQLNRAIALAPDFADAHSAKAYLMLLTPPSQLGAMPDAYFAEARQAIGRALEIDPENRLGQVAQAQGMLSLEGDIGGSIKRFQELLAEYPDYSPVHYGLGFAYTVAGQPAQSRRFLDSAISRDPYNQAMQNFALRSIMETGDYETIVARIRDCQSCELRGATWFYTLASYATPEQFRRDLDELRQLAREEGVPESLFGMAEATLESLIMGRPYRGAPPTVLVSSYEGAAVLARLGFVEEAFAMLEGHERNYPGRIFEVLNRGRSTFPTEVRRDPRYHALFDSPVNRRILAYRKAIGTDWGAPLPPAGGD